LIAASNPKKEHLFVCFNVTLSIYLQQVLKDVPNVRVWHFDGWSREQGISRKFKEDDDSLGRMLLDALKLGKGHARRYSSVFVDEAQDFAASWFSCVREAMEDPLDGDLLIVGDGNQGLYNHREFTWASVGIRAVGRTISAKFDLDRCYRSTKEIMTLAQPFGSNDVDQAETGIAAMKVDPESCVRPSGYKPVIVACSSLVEECQYAAAIVQELIAGKFFGRDIAERLHLSEIGILYREAGDVVKEKLLNDLEKTIGQAVWVSRNRDTRKRIVEPEVKIQTIHSSKGLQYKAVVILWAGQMPSGRSNEDVGMERRLMFVALTRAEDFLAVLHSKRSTFVEELAATEVADSIASPSKT